MGNKKWDNEIDGETSHLIYLVEYGWEYQWPGWRWIADTINEQYHNNRSIDACKKKYKRETK